MGPVYAVFVWLGILVVGSMVRRPWPRIRHHFTLPRLQLQPAGGYVPRHRAGAHRAPRRRWGR